MKKKRIAPSERMEQELMDGLVSEADPLGEAARRGAQLIFHAMPKRSGLRFFNMIYGFD